MFLLSSVTFFNIIYFKVLFLNPSLLICITVIIFSASRVLRLLLGKDILAGRQNQASSFIHTLIH